MTEQTLMVSSVRRCLKEGGRLVFARVKEAEIFGKGTRSQSIRIAAEVLETIHGEHQTRFRAQKWTQSRVCPIQVGEHYVLAIGTRGGPGLQLLAWVPVPGGEADRQAAVERHRQILAEAQQPE